MVAPVTRGRRRALVLEPRAESESGRSTKGGTETRRGAPALVRFWDGPARGCPHRSGAKKPGLHSAVILECKVHQLRRALSLGARQRRRARRAEAGEGVWVFCAPVSVPSLRLWLRRKAFGRPTLCFGGRAGRARGWGGLRLRSELSSRQLPFRLASAQGRGASVRLLWQCNEPTQ